MSYQHECPVCGHKRSMPKTNADRIRAMSDEELAGLLLHGCTGGNCDEMPQNEWGSVNCFDCRMKWLQQLAEEDNDDRNPE